jgi:hypothetical protein
VGLREKEVVPSFRPLLAQGPPAPKRYSHRITKNTVKRPQRVCLSPILVTRSHVDTPAMIKRDRFTREAAMGWLRRFKTAQSLAGRLDGQLD